MENELKMNLPQKSVGGEDSQLMVILEKALTNPDITLEKMNGLLDFQMKIDRINAVKAFNDSMSKAIGEIPSFEKQGKVDATLRDGGKLKYDFARFEDINKVVKPILAKYDLFMSFSHNFDTKGFIDVVAEVTHKDGHSKKSNTLLPFDVSGKKWGVQSVGSTISFGKRYSMNSLLNITTHGEDNDRFVNMKTITTKEIESLNKGIQSSGVELKQLLQFMKVEKLSDILMDEYTRAYDFLKRALEAKKEMESAHDNK